MDKGRNALADSDVTAGCEAVIGRQIDGALACLCRSGDGWENGKSAANRVCGENRSLGRLRLGGRQEGRGRRQKGPRSENGVIQGIMCGW